MSGECAQYPPHIHIMDRLKRRVGEMKQRSNECQARLMTSQSVRVEAERSDTAKLMMKVQENKMRKVGRHKPEPARPRIEPGCEMRNDGSDAGYINLKRKMEMSNGLNHGSIFQSNAGDTAPPSTGVMQNFASPRQNEFPCDNGMDYAKKMKLDSDPQLVSASGSAFGDTGSANSNNCNSGSVTDLTSPQQFSDYLTVSARDSVGESQPPSANPPSNLTLDQGQLLNPSPLEPAFNLNEPQGDRKNVENNLEEFNDDLEKLLNELGGEPFNQNEQQSKPQANTQVQTNSAIRSVTTTEDRMTANPPNQLQMYPNSAGQQQARMVDGKPPQISGIEQLSPPFNTPAAHQMKASPGGSNPQMNNVANGNMTSRHLQNLSVSIDTNFGSPVEQQQQAKAQQMQQMTVNRIKTPSSVDKVHHTPDGAAHQPLGSAMTPSPGSYSMQFHPQIPSKNGPSPGANAAAHYGPSPEANPIAHYVPSPGVNPTPHYGSSSGANPTPNYGPSPSANPTPNYGPSPSANPTPNYGPSPGANPTSHYGPNSPRVQQSSNPNAMLTNPVRLGQNNFEQLSLPQPNQTSYPNSNQRPLTPQMQIVRGISPGMNAPPSGHPHQQMRPLGDRRMMMMTSHNTAPNRTMPGQQSVMGGAQRGNISAANAAAQQVLAASQVQYDRAYVPRMPSVQGNPSTFLDQRSMLNKTVVHNCRNPSCTHNHQAQLVMRNSQGGVPLNGMNPGINSVSNNLSSMASYSPLSLVMNMGSGSNANRDATFVQRQQELEQYKMKVAAQQRDQYQRSSNQPNTSLPVGYPHMGRNTSMISGGMNGGEAAAASFMNTSEVGISKIQQNGGSWNGYYRSEQSVNSLPNHQYNVLSPRSQTFSDPSRSFSPMSKDMINSVPMNRASLIQGSNPMMNHAGNRVISGQVPKNVPMAQSHMRNLYNHSQRVPAPSMMQGHTMTQPQIHQQRLVGRSVPANGINSYGI